MEKDKIINMKFMDKHGEYIGKVYTIMFCIMAAVSSIEVFTWMIKAGDKGQAGTMLLTYIFFMPITMFRACVGTAFYGTIVMVLGFVPHLIYRIIKND